MRWLVLALALFWPLLLAVPAGAQQAATLIADDVLVTDDQRLIARGNVEVLYDGTRLSAAAITYDQASDRLLIDGPIIIVAADGTMFTADQATLDPALANGILLGARLVLDQRLQLAANQINRVEGNLTQLYKVAATSCAVCGDRPPLWEIRAERVVHDQAAQQLYFDNAQFRVRGVPIAWIPQMRLPDPTLTRATGLLVPQWRTTDQLGFGIKLPYFIKLGDHRDLTLTPYASANGMTLEARYRQAFLRGDLSVEGAVSRDNILPDTTRAYLFAYGAFDLGADYRLDFGIEGVTDKGYLTDYDYGARDRLETYVNLTRVRDDSLFTAAAVYYQTLRDDEVNASLPPIVIDLHAERLLFPAALGGTLTLAADVEAHQRYDDTPGDAGRDVAQVGVSADWRRDWVLASGLIGELRAGAAFDYYQTAQDGDPAIDGGVARSTPYAMATFRWPLQRTTGAGVTHILEPVASIAWSDTTGTVANEDSTRVEFDQGNLFALSRFPGQDARETGTRAAVGLTWHRIAPAGWSSQVVIGRVFRDLGDPQFSVTSGLDGTRSDWLVAGQIDLGDGLRVDARSTLDGSLTPRKTEARIVWDSDRVDLTAVYVWLPADAAEDRADDVSEWALDVDYRINDVWSVGANGRYDVAAREPAFAGLSLGWSNECVTAELSVSRRFTSSTSVEPSTSFGLSVGLNGFSAGNTGQSARLRCTN